MYEQVGRENLPGYFGKICELLTDDGILLNQGITTDDPDNRASPFGGRQFIDRYVFPGGELPHIGLALQGVSRGGLEAFDLESLRPHYARTLDIWAQNFELRADDARKIVSSETFRIWRVYLAGFAYAFRSGDVSVYQMTCRKAKRRAETLSLSQPALK